MFLLVYSALLACVLLITAPVWLLRMALTGKYRDGLAERFGRMPARMHAPATGEQTAWLHAVSVGEVLAATRLIAELRRLLPNLQLYISTTTRTGQQLARERFGEARVFYFPLDFAFAMRAWLRFLRPSLVILVESEFWPRMLLECKRARIPVAVVNARISDRSWPRYQRLRRLWRPLLQTLALTLAQSVQDAARLRALGARDARNGGNLKFDARVVAPAAVTTAIKAWLPADVSVVVCGSTLAGEEELLLDALPKGVVTILAPRHPERFSVVAALLDAHAVPYVQRSTWFNSPAPLGPDTVFLLDSLGELASVYALADIAVLGGGFFAAGGHNPLEPAQFAKPILLGPSYENFREIVDTLRAEDAVEVCAASALRETLAALLEEPSRARAMGERARMVFNREAGATARAVAALAILLPGTTLADDSGPPGEEQLAREDRS